MKGKSSFESEEIIQIVFDSFCKRVLKNAAIDCFREIKKHREREQPRAALTQSCRQEEEQAVSGMEGCERRQSTSGQLPLPRTNLSFPFLKTMQQWRP